MATTHATWIEDTTMQSLTNRVNAYLKKYPQVEIVSVSHCMLPNYKFSAMIILKVNSAQIGGGFSEEFSDEFEKEPSTEQLPTIE